MEAWKEFKFLEVMGSNVLANEVAGTFDRERVLGIGKTRYAQSML